LAAAHARGIVHRDMKPDNVFLAHNDSGRIQPKVVDFGIAKMLQPQGGGHKLTCIGTLVGSPEYMAPEQARGHEVDGRSDVWALCVSLYEVLAGVRPFVGQTAEELLISVIQQEPDPLDSIAEVPGALCEIIERGLRKD